MSVQAINYNKFHFNNGILDKIRHFFNPKDYAAEVRQIVTLATTALKGAEGDDRKELIEIADAYIIQHGSQKKVAKILKAFDRQLHGYRDTPYYTHPDNKSQFNKWTRASQPEEIFHQFPKFAEFLHGSKLLSQIKTTRDSLQMRGDEPAMLVEGEWMRASQVMAKFHIENSPTYQTQFVTDSTGQVYTYLDNGLGLQKYHPYQTIGSVPISTLREEQIGIVREKANQFIRSEEKDLTQEERNEKNSERPFVLQLVTSYTNRGTSNFAETVRNARHAYVRIVAGKELPEYNVKKGDVFEFGFGWKSEVLLPFAATQGLLCSPDPWEYMTCDKRYVTCVPINANEAAAAFEFALRQQRKQVQLGQEIGFQLAQQNCTVFDRKIAELTNIAIPTEIQLKPLLYRILPDVIKTVGSKIAAYTKSGWSFAKRTIRTYTPGPVGNWTICTINKIYKIFAEMADALTAFSLLPIRTLLGGTVGEGGASFEEGETIIAPSRNPRNWFRLSSYSYNLPVMMQEWQKEQPSTFVVDNPVRLTIVPSTEPTH